MSTPTPEPMTLLALLDHEALDREAEAHNFAAVGAFDAEADVRARAARIREAAARLREAMEYHATAKNDRDPHNVSLSALIWINGGPLGPATPTKETA